MSDVVVMGLPFEGEITPMLGVARGLAGRGHDVTVVTGSRFAEHAAAAGARFVALDGLADFDDRHLAASFPDAATVSPGPEQLNFLFGIGADTIADQHRAIQALLARSPDAVLVTNSVSFGQWPVALGAPGRLPRRWIAVGANPLVAPSADTTPLGPAPGGTDGDVRAANLAAWRGFEEMLEPSRRRTQAAVDALGATGRVPGIATGITGLPEHFASLTVPGLEFGRSDLPGSVHLVGILPAPPVPPGWEPPPWWPELDTGRPVVTVTQGTLSNTDLGRLVGPALEALADLDVLVVATLGREADALPGPVPANARVERFVPYSALLPRTSVFVTNGGFGATQLALAAGVPVVVAGDTDDKPQVAARVAHRRVGRDLGTGRPTPGQVRAAVLGLLDDADVRGNVGRLAEQYARHDAVAAIESLVLHGTV